MLRAPHALLSLWFLCLELLLVWNFPILKLSNFDVSGILDFVMASLELVVVTFTYKRVLGSGEMVQWVTASSALGIRVWFPALVCISSEPLVISAPGNLMHSSGLLRKLHPCMCVHPHECTHTHTHLK